jgi:SapC
MQLLIYETVVPVSSVRHAKAYVETVSDYGFSKKINSVPLMAVEFPFAAADYAIVFAGTKEAFTPAVILGMRDKENLYLDEQGSWQAGYVPAFVRRYPFVFANSEGNTFTLCIDEGFAGFNVEGRGKPLFNDEGKPSEFTGDMLKFAQEYQHQFQRTTAFCDKLKKLDLLEPMQAQVSLSSGEKTFLTGFLAVDREKLKALETDKLADLVATDELELLYLHLYSMRNFSAVKDKLEGAAANRAARAEPVAA